MYAKLFGDILHSSVWCGQPAAVKLVWICLLATCDRYGKARIGIPGLAKTAEVSMEEASAALDFLMAPDPYSKTEADEGRRVERVDGGLRIINYVKYNELGTAEQQRIKDLEYSRRRRASESVGEGRKPSALSSAQLSSDNQISENPPPPPAEGGKPKKSKPVRAKLLKSYVPTSDATKAEVSEWMARWRVQEAHPEAFTFLDHFRSSGVAHLDWGAAWRNWVKRAPMFSRTPQQAKADVGYIRPASNGAPAWHNEPMITADEHATFAAKLAEAVAKVGT